MKRTTANGRPPRRARRRSPPRARTGRCRTPLSPPGRARPSATPPARPCATACGAPGTPNTARPSPARIRSPRSRPTRPGCPTWCPSGWAAWSPRRSPSCAVRPRSWPPTSPRRRRSARTSRLCGDAHLANFGIYASPGAPPRVRSQRLRRDALGPWEWDLKRLAASFMVASRENGFPEARLPRLAAPRRPGLPGDASVGFAGMRALEVWYACIDVERVIAEAEAARAPGPRCRDDLAQEARRRDHICRPSASYRGSSTASGWLIARPPAHRAARRTAHGRSQPEGHRTCPLPTYVAVADPTTVACWSRSYRLRRRRTQGRRRRQRRDTLLHRPLRRPAGDPLILQVKEALSRSSSPTSSSPPTATRASAS